jgi:hypothetical protein
LRRADEQGGFNACHRGSAALEITGQEMAQAAQPAQHCGHQHAHKRAVTLGQLR